MASLINKSQVKELALTAAAARFKTIPGYSMERVSAEFTDRMEAELHALVVRKASKAVDAVVAAIEGEFHNVVLEAIKNLQAKGKTIR